MTDGCLLSWTSMSIGAVAQFHGISSEYEAVRRRVVPDYDAFYGTAVEALGLARRDIRRVLDLGAGTGLLSGHILTAYPEAQLTLHDGAAGMLEQARATFGERVGYAESDLTDPLPGDEPWDAIVSALAIHHLDDTQKLELFGRLHEGLWPGGIFVNAEQVSGPTAFFDDAYQGWHEREAKANGTTEEEWLTAVERMRVDRTASVERQLCWLREAGFTDVDCLWKNHRLAVIVARRAG
jgi:tRNA (cmo5U34)-methyltransferase